MAGHTPFRKLISTFSQRRKARIAALKKQYEEETVLYQLREASKMTQQALAKRLDISQPAVSRLLRRKNLQLGTLRRVLRAMGAELQVLAVFPGGKINLGFVTRSGRKSRPRRLPSRLAKGGKKGQRKLAAAN